MELNRAGWRGSHCSPPQIFVINSLLLFLWSLLGEFMFFRSKSFKFSLLPPSSPSHLFWGGNENALACDLIKENYLIQNRIPKDGRYTITIKVPRSQRVTCSVSAQLRYQIDYGEEILLHQMSQLLWLLRLFSQAYKERKAGLFPE